MSLRATPNTYQASPCQEIDLFCPVIDITKESTGGKIARCIFAYCAGIDDKSSTSATLVGHDDIVVWSYSVNKGRGAKNRQSMAEAIAKHLNDDYLKKLRKK